MSYPGTRICRQSEHHSQIGSELDSLSSSGPRASHCRGREAHISAVYPAHKSFRLAYRSCALSYESAPSSGKTWRRILLLPRDSRVEARYTEIMEVTQTDSPETVWQLKIA